MHFIPKAYFNFVYLNRKWIILLHVYSINECLVVLVPHFALLLASFRLLYFTVVGLLQCRWLQMTGMIWASMIFVASDATDPANGNNESTSAVNCCQLLAYTVLRRPRILELWWILFRASLRLQYTAVHYKEAAMLWETPCNTDPYRPAAELCRHVIEWRERRICRRHPCKWSFWL